MRIARPPTNAPASSDNLNPPLDGSASDTFKQDLDGLGFAGVQRNRDIESNRYESSSINGGYDTINTVSDPGNKPYPASDSEIEGTCNAQAHHQHGHSTGLPTRKIDDQKDRKPETGKKTSKGKKINRTKYASQPLSNRPPAYLTDCNRNDSDAITTTIYRGESDLCRWINEEGNMAFHPMNTAKMAMDNNPEERRSLSVHTTGHSPSPQKRVGPSLIPLNPIRIEATPFTPCRTAPSRLKRKSKFSQNANKFGEQVDGISEQEIFPSTDVWYTPYPLSQVRGNHASISEIQSKARSDIGKDVVFDDARLDR